MRLCILLFAGLMALSGCTAHQERAGCPVAQQFGSPGAEWRLCPITALQHQRGPTKLVGLGLKHTLTSTELREALTKSPVRVRVAYFTAGNVRGTWAKPSPVSPQVALTELSRLQRDSTTTAMTWTRKNAIQVIQWKNLERILAPSSTNALAQLENSSSLRYGVLNIVREHQAWLDARAVSQGKRGFINGLQVEGTPAQVQAFAQAVSAAGFTLDRAELFNAMRPADPPDLQKRLTPVSGTLNAGELLRLGQLAWADFKSP